MSKIVFFDIDGTLLDDEKNLPAGAAAAIKELQDQGIYTAIATGRAPFMVTDLLGKLGISTYVCYNGQYVVFEGKLIYENPVDKKELKQLDELTAKNGRSLVFSGAETMKASREGDPRVEKAVGSLKLPYPEVDPGYYHDHEIYQALLFARKEEEELYEGRFDKVFFLRWHEEALDVIPVGGSKAEGIKKLIDELGFKMEDTYAFGDGLNDIEMLRTVGTGIAMGNGADAVKECADFVTDHVAKDGIVNGLKKVGLLDPSFTSIHS